MPERWETELGKLATLEPPPRMHARIDEGPRGEGVPPMPGRGQRIAAAVVGLAVFAGAAAFALGAFGDGGTLGDGTGIVPSSTATSPRETPALTGELVATLDAPDDGSLPMITLAYGEEEQVFTGCGGRWNGERIGCRAVLLFFGPPLESGSPLVVRGDADAVDGELAVLDQDLRHTDETIRLDLSDGSAFLPDERGSYGLSLNGAWPSGTAGLYIVITVGEPDVAEPSPLPDVEPGVVPDLVGIGEGDAFKLLYQAGLEGESAFAPVAGVANGLVASTDPAPGTRVDAGATVNLVVSGTTAFSEGTVSVLDCPYEDQMPFAHEGGALVPEGEAFIRANTIGIRDTDKVFKGEDAPAGAVSTDGWWVVDRSDEILAVVDYVSLQGVACRDSGIGGV